MGWKWRRSDILTAMLGMLELRCFLSCVVLFVAALIGVRASVLSTMNGFSVMQLFICQYFNLWTLLNYTSHSLIKFYILLIIWCFK